MKDKVETMMKTSRTNREKSARASAGAFGFSMFGDNVGKVINPRFVTYFYVIAISNDGMNYNIRHLCLQNGEIVGGFLVQI